MISLNWAKPLPLVITLNREFERVSATVEEERGANPGGGMEPETPLEKGMCCNALDMVDMEKGLLLSVIAIEQRI